MFDCGGNVIDVRSLKNDLTYGLHNEPVVIDYLSKYFEEDIKNTKDLGKGKYCCYDAIGNETKYEIKSRRCRYEQYETTIIPVHKCNVEGRLVFVFYFTNGLYYIEYKKEVFEKFEIKGVTVYRQGDNAKTIPHYHIPIQKLIHINI